MAIFFSRVTRKTILVLQFIFGGILLSALPTSCFAGDQDLPSDRVINEQEVYKLGEIVVVGKQPGVESIGAHYGVTAVDIQRKAARTLDEAIELLPGVNVRTAAEGTPRIDVRGFRTRQVKLLLNGVPFNSTEDGQFDPTLITTDYIAEIKLSIGATSELYAGGATSAVINIITKKGYKGLRGNLLGEIGQGGEGRGWGSVSGGTEDADYLISFNHQVALAFRFPTVFNRLQRKTGGYVKTVILTATVSMVKLVIVPTKTGRLA